MIFDRVKKFDIKTFLLFFLFNTLALMPLICFAFQHFSIDSYGIVNQSFIHLHSLISSYRYFGALLFYILTIIGHNPIINSLPDICLYILLVSLSNTLFAFFINNKLKSNSIVSKIIINLSIIITFANVWFTNYLTFPECIFFSALSIFLIYLSIIVLFTNKYNCAIRIILSGIFLICSTAVIQQFLVVFIIYSFLLLSIVTTNKSEKTTLKLYLILILFIIICSVIYFIIGILVIKIYNFIPNSRVALNLDSILSNLKYFAFNQHSYLKGRGFFNTEILTVCYLIVAAIWLVSFIHYVKKHKFKLKSVLLLISYIAAYSSSFGMGLISTSRSHRTMFGLFSVFALFSIGSILLMNNKFAKYVLCAVLITVYGLNIYKTVEMSINQYVTNTTERVYINLYISDINTYEKESKHTVDKIEICTDSHCDTIETESALTVSDAFDPLIRYNSGKKYDVKNMSEDTKNKLFGNNDWKEYVPSEQLIFDNDTLYLCVY